MNTRLYGECWGVGSKAVHLPEKKVKKSKKVSGAKIEWFKTPVPVKMKNTTDESA